MPRKLDPDSLAGIARREGVSPTTVRRWRDELGVDVTDPAAVDAFRKGQVGENRQESGTLAEARRAKVLEETRLLRIRIEQEEGKLISVAEVEQAGVRIGTTVKAGLMRLENDLPPQLEGLSAGEMKKRLRQVLRNLLREFSDYTREAIGRIGEDS